MKKILVLGGTQFIGKNLVNRLIELGEYEITLFNRQRTGTDLFPDISKIKGDRTTDDIQQIANMDWDYVIDVSCYHPNDLKRTLVYLNDDLERYIFISTCSVYDNASREEMSDETAETLTCPKEAWESTNMYKFYGNKKAECERILAKANIDYKILRPALVYGRFDHTDRFYYWLYQVKMNKTLLLPDNGNRLFSITYVDDLVDATIQSLTNNTIHNSFNIVSNPQLSIAQIVKTTQSLLQKSNKVINASPQFLHDNKINQWSTMPLWIDGDYFTYDNQRFIEEFYFEIINFEEATKETIDFYNKLNWLQPKYGMSEQRRRELIRLLSISL